VAGPHGPVSGAIVAAELHSDGSHEDKIFAPGYCEFRTSATVQEANADWRAVSAAEQPSMVAARLSTSLDALTRAVRAHKTKRAAQSAIDVAQSALDLELRYRPAAEIDLGRFRLWTQQLCVEAAAGDLAGVTGAVAVLEWIRARLGDRLDGDIDTRLRALRAATDARNLPAAADHAARLAARVRALTGA
jgi:hypothetical protein